jgi:ATP-dependent Lhr-like helicase
MDALAAFTPKTRSWFERAFAGPTPAQEAAWPVIATGAHVLVQAPTGSGKTLAAFLTGIDRLDATPGEGLRLLYVSPLKALNYDVERNLRGPLAGIGSKLAVGVRTGDTDQRERRRMLRAPPDILITTPESLYLMLTSQARELLTSVETVIVDEVHAVAGTKRGAHLALSLERLARVAGQPFQRIGLSATQRPLEEIGRFVAGGRPIRLVDAGSRKELDLEVVVALDDMREPGSDPGLSQLVLPDGVEMASGYESTARSIWPSIYPALLELVRQHRSTIVFVNNRRLAERLALRLNELADETIARAHHGSLAREQRVEIEELLKAGRIPCLVATSSLELGIDMGAVDLVIQVESPKSVARGLQRVGRAGHELGAVSKGRIFPKFRADLLESAVVAKAMREGAIEETHIPRNPLDVLAQQIVAICAEEEIAVDELHELVRGAYPFADLPRAQLENVLDMLAGRYPSDEFAELRPRIVWDRTAGVVKGRQGARRLAVTNAGTIPDRGLFGVFQVDGGGRVGELDEEMVYEARQGQTFMLGASTWRIEEITRDRVLVSPAPGVPGAVPFWKGEGVGRPFELGEKIGRATREIVALSDAKALGRLREDYHLDPLAARNLLTFLRDQAGSAGGIVPSDRTIVVERFRDEIGDWRVCILTPFGARVHAPWAMALGARLRDALGLEVQSIWSDDGIALHLPEADVPPAVADLVLTAEEIEELVTREVGQTALFGSRFRERRPRAADPAPAAGAAHAPLAAAAEGPEPAPGGAQLRLLPDRARDVPRVPPGRLRPARAEAHPARAADARARPRRGRDTVGLSVRVVAPLRVRRHLHVRGRHAGGRTARTGSLARPRPAAGAARAGGAPRPDRSGGAGRRRGPAPGRRALARRAARPAPAARRPPGRRAGHRLRRRARGGAAGGARADGGGGAPDSGRGCRPLPGRPRGDAARRSAGGVPGGGAGRPHGTAGPVRPRARPLHDRRGGRALRPRAASGRGSAPRARARRPARPRRAPPRWRRP